MDFSFGIETFPGLSMVAQKVPLLHNSARVFMPIDGSFVAIQRNLRGGLEHVYYFCSLHEVSNHPN